MIVAFPLEIEDFTEVIGLVSLCVSFHLLDSISLRATQSNAEVFLLYFRSFTNNVTMFGHQIEPWDIHHCASYQCTIYATKHVLLVTLMLAKLSFRLRKKCSGFMFEAFSKIICSNENVWSLFEFYSNYR